MMNIIMLSVNMLSFIMLGAEWHYIGVILLSDDILSVIVFIIVILLVMCVLILVAVVLDGIMLVLFCSAMLY